MIDYLIEGFRLHQPLEGFQLLADSQYSPAISPRRVSLQVPLMHGEIPAWNDPIDATKLTLRVRITDHDPNQLEHKWNYLRSLCLLGGNRPVTVVREVGDLSTNAQVQLESMDRPDFNAAGHFVSTTMVFHNPSGRWRASDTEDQLMSLNTPAQPLIAASNSTAPITDALIRVRGPLSRVEIRNNANATGLVFQPSVDIAADRYLLIDCTNFTAWDNADSAWETRGSNVSRWLLTTGNGPLALTAVPSLNVGANTSSLGVETAGTSGTTEMYIQARRAYA